MILAASQPAFLPWGGYFGMIDYVDDFLFLDHVQFEKRGRQQRNSIKINGKEHYLTVPVFSKNKRDQIISDVLIDNKSQFIENHIKTIKHNYCKAKYFEKYSKDIFKIYNKKHTNLIDLNIDLIKFFCNILGIKKNFLYLSNLNVSKHSKQDLIFEICKVLKCKYYISSIGAKDYLKDIKKFSENKINLKFFEFIGNDYSQLGKSFIKNLSILDIVFNLGEDSLNYIRENFKIIS